MSAVAATVSLIPAAAASTDPWASSLYPFRDTSAVGSTRTSSYTQQGEYKFVVPAGVTKVDVVVVGQSPIDWIMECGSTNSSGKGAQVRASLAVTAGQTLYAEVAPADESGGRATQPGGAASDIRTVPAGGTQSLSSRLAVAGGGGGGACGDKLGDATGGDAAVGSRTVLSTGSAVVAGADGSRVGFGGGGGATLGGRAGGHGGGIAVGADGQSGAGGGAPITDIPNFGAGGGGGGYFGGGSGGVLATNRLAGGGGAGSSLVPAGGTVSANTSAAMGVTISYTVPMPVTNVTQIVQKSSARCLTAPSWTQNEATWAGLPLTIETCARQADPTTVARQTFQLRYLDNGGQVVAQLYNPALNGCVGMIVRTDRRDQQGDQPSLYSCTNTAAQQFNLAYRGSSWVSFGVAQDAVPGGGLFLDSVNGATAAGTRVSIGAATSADSQQWIMPGLLTG